MKVGLFSPNYPGVSGDGGIGTYTRALARSLTSTGHTVNVVTTGPVPQRVCVDHVQVSVLAHRRLPVLDRLVPAASTSWRIGQEALNQVRAHGLDLFEFPNWEGLGIWFGLRRKVPLIVRLSTSSAESQHIDQLPKTWQLTCDVAREKMQTRLADRLVTHSYAHRQTMAHELGIDPEGITVIPLGVAVYPEFKRTAGARPHDCTVLFLGRMERRKGALDLLHAIPQVLAEVPNTRFVFIGPDRPHCPGGRTHKAYVDETFHGEVRQRIVLAGSLSDDEVTVHMQSADLFVAPSLYESFGLIFLEAMRWGTPVVGTRAGGIPEIVEDGDTGVLVEPGNSGQLAAAIIALLRDPDRRRHLGEAGRRRVEANFSVEVMASKTLQLYEDVLSRHARRSGV